MGREGFRFSKLIITQSNEDQILKKYGSIHVVSWSIPASVQLAKKKWKEKSKKKARGFSTNNQITQEVVLERKNRETVTTSQRPKLTESNASWGFLFFFFKTSWHSPDQEKSPQVSPTNENVQGWPSSSCNHPIRSFKMIEALEALGTELTVMCHRTYDQERQRAWIRWWSKNRLTQLSKLKCSRLYSVVHRGTSDWTTLYDW